LITIIVYPHTSLLCLNISYANVIYEMVHVPVTNAVADL